MEEVRCDSDEEYGYEGVLATEDDQDDQDEELLLGPGFHSSFGFWILP